MVARVKCARSPLLPPRIMSGQTVHCSSLVVAPTEGGPSGPQCLSMPYRPLQGPVSGGKGFHSARAGSNQFATIRGDGEIIICTDRDIMHAFEQWIRSDATEFGGPSLTQFNAWTPSTLLF